MQHRLRINSTDAAQRLRWLGRRYSWWGSLAGRIRSGLGRLQMQLGRGFPFSFKRGLDIGLSIGLLAAASPVLVPTMLWLYASGRRLGREQRVGRGLKPIWLLHFPAPASGRGWLQFLRLHRLPVLFNLLKGDLSFVGPRPLRPEELELRENAGRRRHTDRPGLLCLWWIRERANIDYGSEAEADAEYVDNFSLGSDLGIALRAVPAALFGSRQPVSAPRVRILGLTIDNCTMDEAVERLVALTERPQPAQVCFVNADCANLAQRDGEYRAALQRADVVLADGIGMKLAGKLLRTGIRQNVNGTDLFPRLCERLATRGKRLFLLGARSGVADQVAEWVARNYPAATVCGVQHGYFDPGQETEVLERIRESRPDILLVAFGAPKQDLWIRRNLAASGARVAVGVGGLFDFFSGNIPRAPQWMREIGMEWFYRFLQEPHRMWRRYLVGNVVFLARVLFRMAFPEPPVSAPLETTKGDGPRA